jgi:hypothetical protein
MNTTANPTNTYTVPSVSITTAHTGASSKANELGMRTMQERVYAKRGEQYLLIKSPPASGKSRAAGIAGVPPDPSRGIEPSPSNG